jgi:hypothetical protein
MATPSRFWLRFERTYIDERQCRSTCFHTYIYIYIWRYNNVWPIHYIFYVWRLLCMSISFPGAHVFRPDLQIMKIMSTFSIGDVEIPKIRSTFSIGDVEIAHWHGDILIHTKNWLLSILHFDLGLIGWLYFSRIVKISHIDWFTLLQTIVLDDNLRRSS